MQGGGLDCGDNDGGTGHVAFHVAHVGGRFQGNAAGIESDAFTDQTEVEFFGVFSAFPLQHGHPRGIDRTLGNRQQHVHAEVMQLGFVENGDVDAEIIQTFDVGGVNFRREVVGRFVAEVAGIADGVGQSAVGGKLLIIDLRFAQKFDFFQFGVAVSRLFGEIFVKAVAAEFYSEGYAGRGFAGGKRVRFVGGNENGGGFFAADFLIEFAAENLQVERVWPGARAGGDDPGFAVEYFGESSRFAVKFLFADGGPERGRFFFGNKLSGVDAAARR